jgi:hypothetical protein
MTRYQTGFNPYVGAVSLPKNDRMETAKVQYVANSADKVSAAKPFQRVFDLWSTGLKLAVAEDVDPIPCFELERRRFHDNIGVLIANDIPLMALIATVATRHGYRYESKTFEEAIGVLDEPGEQVKVANVYAHAGAERLLDVLEQHGSAPGPALTRHFHKLLKQAETAPTAIAG